MTSFPLKTTFSLLKVSFWEFFIFAIQQNTSPSRDKSVNILVEACVTISATKAKYLRYQRCRAFTKQYDQIRIGNSRGVVMSRKGDHDLRSLTHQVCYFIHTWKEFFGSCVYGKVSYSLEIFGPTRWDFVRDPPGEKFIYTLEG